MGPLDPIVEAGEPAARTRQIQIRNRQQNLHTAGGAEWQAGPAAGAGAPIRVLRLFRLQIELDPDRNMVGWLFPGAHMLVDAGGGQAVGGLRREQQMIDADAVVLLPGAGLVVPERIEPARISIRT